MPESKSRNKKYDPGKVKRMQAASNVPAYSYTLPPLVKGCGEVLLWFYGGVVILMCVSWAL